MDFIRVNTQDRGYDKIFDKTFGLHRLLGTFPFYIKKDSIKTSYKLLIATAVMVCLNTYYLMFIDEEIQLEKRFVGEIAFMSTYYCPDICLFAVPICNVVWLYYKRNKLNDIFRDIKNIETVTRYKTPDLESITFFLQFLILTINAVIYFFTMVKSNSYTSVIVLSQVNVYLCFAVLNQFSSLIRIIQRHYQYIIDTLDMDRAEKWCRCQEILGDCCINLSDCYSPQLLLIIVSNFVIITSTAYQITVSQAILTNFSYMLMSSFWMIVNILASWYIVVCCSQTTQKAKEFDNLLYEIIINDTSCTLVKNKRIVLHFKVKRKEVFSAMGFFNFDYPLLCSMVSSATTYVVILLQFS